VTAVVAVVTADVAIAAAVAAAEVAAARIPARRRGEDVVVGPGRRRSTWSLAESVSRRMMLPSLVTRWGFSLLRMALPPSLRNCFTEKSGVAIVGVTAIFIVY
jgi:hypothetical protein